VCPGWLPVNQLKTRDSADGLDDARVSTRVSTILHQLSMSKTLTRVYKALQVSAGTAEDLKHLSLSL